MSDYKNKFINILRWSEKYTGTDMLYLAKGGFWLSLLQVSVLLNGFITTLALTRLLPREIYGQYRYVMSISAVLAIFALNGIDIALIQAISRGYGGDFIKGLKTKIKWGSLGALICLIIGLIYLAEQKQTLAWAFFLIAPFLPFVYSFTIFNSILAGKKDFKTQSVIMATVQTILTVTVVGLLFIFPSLHLTLFAIFFLQTALYGYFLFATFRRSKMNDHGLPETLPYGKRLSIIGLVENLALNLDEIIIQNLLGSVALAIYAVAILLPKQVNNAFLNIFHTLSLPKFASSDSDVKNTLVKKIIKLSLAMSLLAIAYFLVAPSFYHWMFPKYPESVAYTRIYVLILLLSPFTIINYYFKAKLAEKKLYTLTLGNMLARIVLYILLLPPLGIWGAVLSPLIVGLLNIPVSLYFLSAEK